MRVVLYWMSISHPSQVARKMLDLKGIEYELVDVVPLNQVSPETVDASLQ